MSSAWDEDEVVATLHGDQDPDPAVVAPSLAERMVQMTSFRGVKRLYRKMLGTQVDV